MADRITAHELRGRELATMRVLHELREASVQEVRAGLPGRLLSPSAIRTILGRLVDKGHAAVASRDGRNVYRPRQASGAARRSAVDRVVTTFFDGSTVTAAITLLDRASTEEIRDPAVRKRLERLVEELRDREANGS